MARHKSDRPLREGETVFPLPRAGKHKRLIVQRSHRDPDSQAACTRAERSASLVHLSLPCPACTPAAYAATPSSMSVPDMSTDGLTGHDGFCAPDCTVHPDTVHPDTVHPDGDTGIIAWHASHPMDGDQ